MKETCLYLLLLGLSLAVGLMVILAAESGQVSA